MAFFWCMEKHVFPSIFSLSLSFVPWQRLNLILPTSLPTEHRRQFSSHTPIVCFHFSIRSDWKMQNRNITSVSWYWTREMASGVYFDFFRRRSKRKKGKKTTILLQINIRRFSKNLYCILGTGFSFSVCRFSPFACCCCVVQNKIKTFNIVFITVFVLGSFRCCWTKKGRRLDTLTTNRFRLCTQHKYIKKERKTEKI